MARRLAPIGDRLAAAIENARDPRDRALLAEVADVIAQLTRAHYDMVAALAIADRRGIDPIPAYDLPAEETP